MTPGARPLVFATGCGLASGDKPGHCIKVATRLEMVLKLTEDMDRKAGDALSCVTPGDRSREMAALFIHVAAGRIASSDARCPGSSGR